MQCKDLEFVLESEGLGTLSAEAREHLAECSSCQGLLADFHSIVAVARTLPREVEPPVRVWVSLRAQLEAEGLIKEPVEARQPTAWWEVLRAVFEPRALALAAAALLLVAGTVFVTHRQGGIQPPVAKIQPVTEPSHSQQTSVPAPPPVAPNAAPPTDLTAIQRAPHSPKNKELASSPSENVSDTLAPGEPSPPGMQFAGDTSVDVSFRQNLRTLNQFIAECQRRLRQNPQDELAREYLNMAYQQKADLLATMMDNGRSEH